MAFFMMDDHTPEAVKATSGFSASLSSDVICSDAHGTRHDDA
jgi:hypothetical protein